MTDEQRKALMALPDHSSFGCHDPKCIHAQPSRVREAIRKASGKNPTAAEIEDSIRFANKMAEALRTTTGRKPYWRKER